LRQIQPTRHFYFCKKGSLKKKKMKHNFFMPKIYEKIVLKPIEIERKVYILKAEDELCR